MMLQYGDVVKGFKSGLPHLVQQTLDFDVFLASADGSCTV